MGEKGEGVYCWFYVGVLASLLRDERERADLVILVSRSVSSADRFVDIDTAISII